ncbi:MAG: hypothetical protein ACRCZF_06940 [Gemmataceae bacterium]
MMPRWIIGIVLVAAVGCSSQEDIRVYSAPKPVPFTPPTPTMDKGLPGAAPPDAPGTEYRILGAMFPADAPSWFFKLTGKAQALETHQANFEKLIRSVRFPNGLKKMPLFDLPTGWTLAGANPAKLAEETIQVGPAEAGLLITIVPAGGDPKGNVERWANQVGQAVPPEGITKLTRLVDAEKISALYTDLRGPKNPSGRGPMMAPR